MTKTNELIDHAAHAELLLDAERRRQRKALETAESNIDRRRTKASTDEIIDLAGLEEKSKAAIERRARLEAFVKTLKIKTEKCERHGELKSLDVDQMSRESRGDEWVIRFRPCSKCEIESRGEWLKKIGVPENLLHATLDNWEARTQAEKYHALTCKQFVRRGRGFIVITNATETQSKYGIGKTHLAIGILREIGTGRFIKQREFTRKVRKRYNDRYQEDIVEAAIRARCLVFDELGWGLGGEDEKPAIETVLDARYDSGLPTVITTNLTAGEMFEYLGGRLESRLEAAIWKTIEISGTNRRTRE